MGKRFFILICSVLIFSCFCIYSFLSPVSIPASAASGGGGYRSEPVDDDYDYDSSNAWQGCVAWFSSCLDGHISDQSIDIFLNSTGFHDLVSFACGTVGAIFTDQTMESVFQNFCTMYAQKDLDGYVDTDFLHEIFYVGKDGNLYFTDDFIQNAQSISDEALFSQGILKFPCWDDTTFFYNLNSPYVNSLINNALSGHPLFITYHSWSNSEYIQYLYVSSDCYFNQFSNYFTSYQNYLSFVNGNSNRSSALPLAFSSEQTLNQLDFSDGNLTQENISSKNFSFLCPHASASGWSSSQWYLFFSDYPLQVYNSSQWYEFYANGGVGALLTNIHGSLNDALSSDFFDLPWSDLYDSWQSQYADLASQVASGSLALSDISSMLSDDINDSLKDIEENTEVQTKYLKKIVDILESISKKLTYSNVIGTVNAASNLLSSITDFLNDLFDDAEGSFHLLDFVSDGLSDTMRSVFPFSLPHDLLLVYELLSVSPKVPQVEFHFELARLGISYDYLYTANDFQKLAYVTRFFSSIGFVILLINLTEKMLKK